MKVHKIQRPAKSERLTVWLDPIVAAARSYVAEHAPDPEYAEAGTYGPHNPGELVHGEKLWHALQVVNLSESITEHQRLGHLEMTAICVGELVSHAYLSDIPALIEATGRQKQKERAKAERKPMYNRAFQEVADAVGKSHAVWDALLIAMDRLGADPVELTQHDLQIEYTEDSGKRDTVTFAGFRAKLSRHRNGK